MSKEYEEFCRLLKNTISTIPQSFYDMYIEHNVKKRTQAGLKEYIIRRQLGQCCKWCAGLAGIYEYSKVNPNSDIFKRHSNCRCMITHKTERGYVDLWSTETYKTQKEARITNAKRIEQEIERNNNQRKKGEALEKEIDTPKVSSYNFTPKLIQELENAYDTSVDKGMISPLVGFDTYLKDYKWIENNIVGLLTSNGIKITGQTRHFLERRYGTVTDPGKLTKNGKPVKREGVTLKAIRDALLNGLTGEKQIKNGKPSITFYSNECMVTVNPETGKIIQCNKKRI